jgi:diketogulonate reductase-like aldo/keto reductase
MCYSFPSFALEVKSDAQNPEQTMSGMAQRTFGPTGRSIGIIGQGTWRLEGGDKAEAIAALRRGLDLGMNHIDTAEYYGWGAAETVIGEAIRGRHDEIFLVSKVVPDNASQHGVIAACERSLKSLGCDRLDCYLLHWPGRHPLEDTIAGFEELVRAGKIKSWGLSNFDVAGLEEALKLAGPGRIACNQVLYHLKQRTIEHAVVPWCQAHNVAVVGYSPFGHGDFPGPDSAGGRALQAVAKQHGASPRQIALAFLTRQPPYFAIPKASRLRHVEENAGAGALQLSRDDIAKLDAAFPVGKRSGSLPMI